MGRCPQNDPYRGGVDVAGVPKLCDGGEKRARIALVRINGTTVHYGKRRAWRRDNRHQPVLSGGKSLLVVAIFDGGKVARLSRIAARVLAQSALRGKDRSCGMADGALFYPIKAFPDERVGRITLLRHGISKVGSPWDTAQSMQGQAD